MTVPMSFTRPNRIPFNIWVLIFVCYLMPIIIELLASDSFLGEIASSIVWFLYLIPSVFFSYYSGLKGGMVSTLLSVIIHVLIELLDNMEGKIDGRELLIMGEIAFANILLIFPISRLIEKLNSERLRLELLSRELARSEEQLQNIFNNLDVAIWSFDVQEQSIRVSTGLERLYGISRERILKDSTSLWKERIHPEDRWIAEDLEKQLFSGHPSKAELAFYL